MDWGLVQSIDPDIQTTLIAHISHLVGKDYAKIPADLGKLMAIEMKLSYFLTNESLIQKL